MSEIAEETTLRQLTLLPEASLASLTAWPGSDEARTMTVTSGQNIADLLQRSDPVGCLLKTCLVSSTPCSTRCYLTWKVSTTPQGRLLYRLWPSTPRIEGCGSSLWPTVQAQMPGAGSENAKVQNLLTGNRHSFYLTQTVEAERQKSGVITGLWPTPNAPSEGRVIPKDADWKGRTTAYKGGKKLQVGLESAVRLWPTPSTLRGKRQSGRMDEWGGSGARAMLSDVPVEERIGQLNPTWVEWLQGFPLGWTIVEE